MNKWSIGKVASIGLVALAACRPSGVELETMTFELQNLSHGSASDLIMPYVYLEREGNPGTVGGNRGALTVRETRDNLERIAAVLAEFDQPAPTYRLRFQLIEANGFPERDPDVAAVEQELRGLFTFDGYRLMGDGVVTTIADDGFQQRIASTDPRIDWTLQGRLWNAGAGLRLQVQLMAGSRTEVLTTTATIQPGRTLVLGSAKSQGAEGAWILTVRPEIVD